MGRVGTCSEKILHNVPRGTPEKGLVDTVEGLVDTVEGLVDTVEGLVDTVEGLVGLSIIRAFSPYLASLDSELMKVSGISQFRRGRLTQKELAAIAHLRPETLCRIEKGRRQPTDKQIGQIAAALGVERNELMEMLTIQNGGRQ